MISRFNPEPNQMNLTCNIYGNEIKFGSIGAYTFVNSLNFNVNYDENNFAANLHIGKYCSIARNIEVSLNRNHDYKSVSNVNKLWLTELFYDTNNTISIKQKGQVIIGSDTWIGDNVIILPGVTIGSGAVIGAGAVVAKDIPPYSIAVGNPIRVIKYRFSDNQIEKLLKIKWWNWDVEKIKKNKLLFNGDIDRFIDTFYEEYQDDIKAIDMAKKSKSILLIPDFEEVHYPVWKNVLKEFVNSFSNEDDITLLLRIESDNKFQNKMKQVTELINGKENLPDILIINDTIDDERSLFKDISYYITTRSSDTLKYIEIAEDFQVKVISGVDIPIFDVISN